MARPDEVYISPLSEVVIEFFEAQGQRVLVVFGDRDELVIDTGAKLINVALPAAFIPAVEARGRQSAGS